MVIRLLKQKSLSNIVPGKLSVSGQSATLYVPPTPGKLFSWGYNRFGNMGIGVGGPQPSPYYSFSSPVQVGSLATWTYVSTGWNEAFGRQSDGSIWAWGENDGGMLGLGDRVSRSSPTQLGTSKTWLRLSSGSNSGSAGLNHGKAYLWGYIGAPYLVWRYYNGGQEVATNPVQIGARTDWSDLMVQALWAMGIINGKLYTWGENDWGQLGQGNYTSPFHGTYSPAQVGSRTDWTKIIKAINLTSFATTSDGTLWAWGQNNVGQCGLGTTVPQRVTTPTQVLGNRTWSQVVGGEYSILAIDSNGYLWGWGNNSRGELGLGNTTQYLSPVQVGTRKWKSIATHRKFSLGVTTDGALWSWGSNQYGKLGRGNPSSTYACSSPVQVGAATTWIACFSSQYTGFAIRT